MKFTPPFGPPKFNTGHATSPIRKELRGSQGETMGACSTIAADACVRDYQTKQPTLIAPPTPGQETPTTT